MNPNGYLDAKAVIKLFEELSDRLKSSKTSAQLFVVGGAAMALAYDSERITRDVDALFVPTTQVRKIAAEIALNHGLESDWLNDAAKGFLPGEDENPRIVFESDYLLVQIPSAKYLLAMKLHASRDEKDLDDAVVLCRALGYSTAEECIGVLSDVYSGSQLLPRHRYVVEEVVARITAN